MLCYGALSYESVKTALTTLDGYERSHESSSSAINDAEDVSANIVSVFTAVKSKEIQNSSKISYMVMRTTNTTNVTY